MTTTETGDMERLAGILAAHFYPQAASTMEGALNSIPSQQRRKCVEAARSFLEELKQPSERMCMAHAAKEWDDWTAYDLWQAMLNSILNEDS